MTKRDIMKYLENKHQEKRSSVRDNYQAERDQLIQGIYSELGTPELAGKIQSLLDEVSCLWENWKSKVEGHEGVNIKNYYTLEYWLNNYVDSEGATFQKITESLRVETTALADLHKAYSAQLACVDNTYNTVISTVQQMRSAKQGAAYLKELEFDLSILESPAEPVQTALMVPINKRFLFVDAA